MRAPASRRGFLRSLLTLPLIGGGVSLIGAPSAVAQPVTRQLLETYSAWLMEERMSLHEELFPEAEPVLRHISAVPVQLEPENQFYIPPLPSSWDRAASASTRAALVLASVGCEWREGIR